MFGFKEIGAIVIICYLVGMWVKNSKIDNSYIPTIVGTVGAILGVVAMYTMPELGIPSVLDALAYGVVSGLAATGIDQMYKQIERTSNQ